MAFTTSTLRPGLLVALSTSLRGNVQYVPKVIEADHRTEDGKQKATWETTRIIEDPAEHEAGVKARGKARSIVTAVCSQSSFGLLCAEASRDRLTKAIEEAQAVARDFNSVATLSVLSVNVMVGRIASDDVQAVKAINSEVADLMEQMEDGIKRLDVKAVREAANRAKQLEDMLSAEATGKMQVAIETARRAARQISKAAEVGAADVDTAAINRIREMRTQFLDLDDAGTIAAPQAQARAIDLDPDVADVAEQYIAKARATEVMNDDGTISVKVTEDDSEPPIVVAAPKSIAIEIEA
jgi:hypothetical protein